MEFPQPHRPEQISSFRNTFSFDSVNVNLVTDCRKTIDFCNSYFDSYTQIVEPKQTRDWTVIEHIDPYSSKPYWKVDEESNQVNIVGNEYDSRLTMRVVRSLVMLEDINMGKIMFKGGAFVNRGGHGIALMGEKRTGKTSMILGYMLRNDPEAKFVTNSHVSVGLEEDAPYAYGYPMSVGVRLRVLESIKKRGNANVVPVIDDLKTNLQPGDENRYYIDPDRLKMHFNGRVVNKTKLDAIIFAKSIPSKSRSCIRRLSAGEVENDFIRYYNRHLKNDGWYNLFHVDMKKQLGLINEMLNRTELYELTFNVDSHTNNIDLIDQIL